MGALVERCLGALARLPLGVTLALALAAGSLVIELGLRFFAPRSAARAGWLAAHRALGRLYLAVLLALAWALVLGPLALAQRVMGRDPWTGEPRSHRKTGLRARTRRRSDRRSALLPW